MPDGLCKEQWGLWQKLPEIILLWYIDRRSEISAFSRKCRIILGISVFSMHIYKWANYPILPDKPNKMPPITWKLSSSYSNQVIIYIEKHKYFVEVTYVSATVRELKMHLNKQNGHKGTCFIWSHKIRFTLWFRKSVLYVFHFHHYNNNLLILLDEKNSIKNIFFIIYFSVHILFETPWQ